MATGWRQVKEERPRLTSRTVASLPLPNKSKVLYDPDLIGFGVRLTPPSIKNRYGTRTWIVEYRPGTGGRRVAKRRVSLGRTDKLSAEDARRRAKEILADVCANGDDPAGRIAKSRSAGSVDQLKDRYFSATNPFRKPRTRELYDGLWRIHISPAIGSVRIDQITKLRIAELHAKIGEKQPATANRVVVLMSHFIEWCRDSEIVEMDKNPARGIRKFPAKHRERYLSPVEFARLGRAISKAETTGVQWTPDPNRKTKHAPRPKNRAVKINAFSASAFRLLIFTGARLREVLNLEWSHVDLEQGLLVLPDSKTGPKRVMLPAPAIEIFRELEKVRSRLPRARFVIEGKDPSRPRADLQRPWKLVRDEAGLIDFRLHDLRHSFASVGAGSNLGLPVLGALLGHSDPATTSRYAHLANEPLRAASDGIAKHISEMLNG